MILLEEITVGFSPSVHLGSHRYFVERDHIQDTEKTEDTISLVGFLYHVSEIDRCISGIGTLTVLLTGSEECREPDQS